MTNVRRVRFSIRVTSWFSIWFAICFYGASAWAAGPRVIIMIDNDGISGVARPENEAKKSPDFIEFKRVLSKEVNAAIEGSLAANATKITIWDTSDALMLSELPPKVNLIRGAPLDEVPCAEMQTGYDAVVMLGIHASAHAVEAGLNHTLNPQMIEDISLNGVPASESMIMAACAGQHGASVVFAAGDAAGVDEFKHNVNGQIVGVALKRSWARLISESFPLAASVDAIREGVKEGLGKLGSIKPFKVNGTPTVEVTLANRENAEGLAMLPLPGLERLSPRTYRYVNKNIIDVLRFCIFVARYNHHKPEAIVD